MDELQKRLREGIRQRLSQALERGKNASTTGVLGSANKYAPSQREYTVKNLVKPTVSRISTGVQAGSRLFSPTLRELQRPNQSILQRNINTLRDVKDFGAGVATVAGLARLPMVGAIGLTGAGINTAFRAVQGQKPTRDQFFKDTVDSLNRGIPTAGVLSATGPMFNQVVGKIAPKIPLAPIVADRGSRAVVNIGEGLIIDQATGLPTTPLSIGIDAAAGLAGAGSPRGALKGVDMPNAKGFGDLYTSDIKVVRDALDMSANGFKRADGSVDLDALTQATKDAETYRKAFKLTTNKQELKEWRALGIDGQFRMIAEKMRDLQSGGQGIKMGIKGSDETVGPLIQEARQSGDIKVKERGVISTAKQAEVIDPTVQASIQGKYRVKPNKQTVERAVKAVDENFDKARREVLEGPLSAENNAKGLEIVRRYQQQGQYDQAAETIEAMSRKATAAGQYNQAFAIWNKMTPEGMVKYAQNEIRRGNENMGVISKTLRKALKREEMKLDTDDLKQINDLMRKANNSTTEADQAVYVRKAFEVMNKKMPWGVSDVLDEYRYNNMLSNPLTHLRNVYSNLLQTYVTRPSTLAAQGKISDAVKYEVAAIKALPEAFNAFKSAMRGDTGPTRLDLELKQGLKGVKVKRLGKLYNLPSDAMEAGDKFFSTLIREGELARGVSEADANKVAQYSLFRGELKPEGQGYLLNKIDDITGAMFQLRRVGLGWAIPFLQTPMNVAKQWIEYSPAGFATTLGAANKGEQVAKALLGSIATAAGVQLAMQDRVTWAAPTDPTAKKLFYDTGRRPYSIKIKDKWVPLSYLGPFAWAAGLPAAYKYYDQEAREALTDEDYVKLAKASMSGLGFWSQQTFVSGLGTFVKLAEGDVDYTLPRNIGNMASQLNPMVSLQRWVAQNIDPIYRKPKTIADVFKASTPFLSKDVPAYETSTGEPSTRLRVNSFIPYAIGQADQSFEDVYKARLGKLQQNAVENKEKKDMEAGSSSLGTGGARMVGSKILYQDLEDGTIKDMDLSFLSKEPTSPVAKARYEEKKYDTALNIFRNESLPEDIRTEALNTIGINSDDLAYYDIATSENTIKSIYVKDAISGINNREQLIQTLVDMRRPVNNKFILSDGVIDDLVENETLSKDEGKALKNIDFTLDGKLKVKMTGRGKSSRLKNIKFVPLDIPTSTPVSLGTPTEGLRLPQGGMNVDRIRVQNIRPAQIGEPKFQVKFNL